jgi:hypothetical protein
VRTCANPLMRLSRSTSFSRNFMGSSAYFMRNSRFSLDCRSGQHRRRLTCVRQRCHMQNTLLCVCCTGLCRVAAVAAQLLCTVLTGRLGVGVWQLLLFAGGAGACAGQGSATRRGWCAHLCIHKCPTFFSNVLSILRSDFSSINWTCGHNVKNTMVDGGLAGIPQQRHQHGVMPQLLVGSAGGTSG